MLSYRFLRPSKLTRLLQHGPRIGAGIHLPRTPLRRSVRHACDEEALAFGASLSGGHAGNVLVMYRTSFARSQQGLILQENAASIVAHCSENEVDIAIVPLVGYLDSVVQLSSCLLDPECGYSPFSPQRRRVSHCVQPCFFVDFGICKRFHRLHCVKLAGTVDKIEC